MSYSSEFSSTFNIPTLGLTSEKIHWYDQQTIRAREYAFVPWDIHRYQGVRESQKFQFTYDTVIRANLFFNDRLDYYDYKILNSSEDLQLTAEVLAQIVHTRLQLEFKLYQLLNSTNSEWFW